MNKTVRRTDENEKKNDVKVKATGDAKTLALKYNNTRLKKEEIKPEVLNPDGDSGRVFTNLRQVRTKVKPREESRSVHIGDGRPDRRLEAKEAVKRAVMELKRIREKYSLNTNPKNSPSGSAEQSKKENLQTAEVKSDAKNSTAEQNSKSQDVSQTKENDIKLNIATNDTTDLKIKNGSSQDERKPLIKTVVGKNSFLPIYKAVTFVPQKRKRTALDIKIPNPETCTAKINPSKYTDTSFLENSLAANVGNRSSFFRRTPRRRDVKRVKRTAASPVRTMLQNVSPPPTEIAKWAPASVNRETKPYYEAWVNTRPAAVSKYQKNINPFLYNDTFPYNHFMGRPTSPDLVYTNLPDERFTGKIKITQKQLFK